MSNNVENMTLVRVNAEEVTFAFKLASFTATRDWWDQEGQPEKISVAVSY